MTVTQADRILAVLLDGREHTLAEIHRKAGHSIVHSRISDLRKKGCVIDHRTKPHKKGATASVYRLVSAPAEAVMAGARAGHVAALLRHQWDEDERIAREQREAVPRDDSHRFRVYGVGEAGILRILDTAPTEGLLGSVILRLGREGRLRGLCLGVLDTHGTDTASGTWVVNPWDQA
jgi:hypothetical protein